MENSLQHQEHQKAQEHQEHATTKQYIQIAVALTLITLFEVIYPYATEGIDFLNSFYMPLLGILSLVKFYLVVAYYMHLRYDITLLKQIFIFTFFLAILISFALFKLFYVF